MSTTDYEAYDYDANGNRTSLRKRDGRTIIYDYDALNRLVSKTYPQGGARGVYYSYDLRGLQTAARYDGPGGGDAVLSGWDGFGRQTSSTTAMAGLSRTLSYGYDANGARTSVTHPDGSSAYYHRDGLDRIYFTSRSADGSGQLFHPQYDGLGRVSALYRLIGGSWAIPSGYGYDGIDRLTAYNHAPGINPVNTTLGYNPASQITSRTRNNDAFAYTGHATINRGYAVNGLNQYTSAGGLGFSHDPNGNLTSDGVKGYGYDIENRLISVSTGLQLEYDPTGRLWRTSGGGERHDPVPVRRRCAGG